MKWGIVIGAVACAVVGWAMLSVPPDHGRTDLTTEVGASSADCMVQTVADEWPNRVIGPWAIEPTQDAMFRVYGAFGQEWEFRQEEGALSTSGWQNRRLFGDSSCR